MDDLLLQKFIRNEVSDKELETVLGWLEENPENQKTLDRLDFIMNAETLHGSREKVRIRGGVHRKKVTGIMSGIAAVLVAGILLTALLPFFRSPEEGAGMLALSVPNGQYVSLTLQDGTQVWLNSGTTIEYPAVFSGKERKVRVEGEALFDVSHDEKHPFIVETYACDVRVLGTRFNISAEKSEGIFSVALLEGRLRVGRDNAGLEPVYLSANETVRLVGDRLEISKITSLDDYRWQEGILNLNNMCFRDVMKKFEKYYGVNIVIETDKVPSNRYNGKINVSDGIDYALQLLQLTSRFHYRKDTESNTIIID